MLGAERFGAGYQHGAQFLGEGVGAVVLFYKSRDVGPLLRRMLVRVGSRPSRPPRRLRRAELVLLRS
ncbi:hypothetical protein NicSoilB11_18250 [Arthrobacter sp. NicSoilB11]|nr:hypothetical protein NicSoilB11_18250 [Arthrobacter sp. NicSoilB11]